MTGTCEASCSIEGEQIREQLSGYQIPTEGCLM